MSSKPTAPQLLIEELAKLFDRQGKAIEELQTAVDDIHSRIATLEEKAKP